MYIKEKCLQYILLYLDIYAAGTLKAWLIHTRRVKPIGQLTGYLCTFLIYTVYILKCSSKPTIFTSPFNEKSPAYPTACYCQLFKFCTYMFLNYISMFSSILIWLPWLCNWTMLLLYTTTWIQHCQWVWCRPISLILTIFSSRVGSPLPLQMVLQVWYSVHEQPACFYVSWNDSNMSMNLSLYAYLMLQSSFYLCMHLYVFLTFLDSLLVLLFLLLAF